MTQGCALDDGAARQEHSHAPAGRVMEGEAVKAGQTIFVLEAMKIESDIVAPVAGTVRGIAVAKGASVAAGGVLCSIQ